jgi:glucokinase
MISGKPELLKQINTGIIVEMVRREGPLSRSELAKRLNMSRPTVSKLVSDLLAEQTIIEVGHGPSNGGKRPIYLQINSRGAYVIGIHVAYPTVKIVLANNMRAFLQRSSFQTPDSLDKLVSLIKEHVEELLRAAGLAKGDLSAVGIAFSGIVNPLAGEVMNARFFPFVKGTQFKEQIESLLEAPVFIDNDVYMGVLGEAEVLEKQPQSIVFVTLGAMIGLGIMIEGQVYRGAKFAASEIGDMIIDSSKQLANGYRPEGGYLERWLVALGKEEILQAARKGDQTARRLVEEDQMKVACLLANIQSIFDPEQFIVGGTILRDHDLFIPQVRHLLLQLTGRPIDIVTAHYLEDSELAGSVSKAIQSLHNKISIKHHTL